MRLYTDCVDHNKLCETLKEMGISDHLTCLLRNLYAGQEATVRTGHRTTDWFQIGKGVHQDYTFRYRSACRTPAENGQEYLSSGKEYIEHAKLGRKKELGGKTGVLVGLDLPSVGEETEAGVQLPNQDHCLNQRRNI